MRKNKSSRQVLSKGRRSQGREISIELEGSYKHSQRYEQPASDRQERSLHPISHNILKDIINYSHLSHSTKHQQNTTVASFDRDLLSHLSKIHKKAEVGRKLTLDQPIATEHGHNPQDKLYSQGRSPSVSQQVIQSQPSSAKHSVAHSKVLGPVAEEIAARLDQLQLQQEALAEQHPQMAQEWTQLIDIEAQIDQLSSSLAQLNTQEQQLQTELQSTNWQLFETSRALVDYRRDNDFQGTAAKNKVIEEAVFAHQELLRKLATKDFEETVLFNMKVAIPTQKGKTSVRQLYEELFRHCCAKKFTMILKKHSAHMDLYDGKVLGQFTKKINDLEGQWARCDQSSSGPQDQQYLQTMGAVVDRVETVRAELIQTSRRKAETGQVLAEAAGKARQCEGRIQAVIEEMNWQVRGEYERQTDKAADFRALLTAKYARKYAQFKQVWGQRQQVEAQLRRLQS